MCARAQMWMAKLILHDVIAHQHPEEEGEERQQQNAGAQLNVGEHGALLANGPNIQEED